MVLQFNPPDWIIKDYLDRKTPAQQASEGIGNALGTYAKMKSDEEAKQNTAMTSYINAFKVGGPKFAMDVAKRYGLKNPPALPGVTATMVGNTGVAGEMIQPGQQNAPATAPTAMPEMAPTPNENAAQMSMPSEHEMPMTRGPQMGQPTMPQMGSPIVAHWNQTRGAAPQPTQPQAPSQNSQLPTLPGDENPLDLINQGDYGDGRIKILESVQKIKDAQDARVRPITYYDAKGNKQFEIPAGGKILPGSTTSDNRTFIGNDADGNPLFADKAGSITSGTVPGGGPVLPKTSTEPTQTTRASAEFADTILPHIKSMRDLITEADKKGFIGPGAGRVYGKFLAGQVGSTGNKEADRLLGRVRSADSLLKTGAMRVHFGARGGQEMYDHFTDLLNSGQQSAAMLNGSLDEIESFMQGYSDAGKVKRTNPGPQGKKSSFLKPGEEAEYEAYKQAVHAGGANGRR